MLVRVSLILAYYNPFLPSGLSGVFMSSPCLLQLPGVILCHRSLASISFLESRRVLLYGIGSISKGWVPFSQIPDTQGFVASVKIVTCALQSKIRWLCLSCLYTGQRRHRWKLQLPQSQTLLQGLSSSLDMFVAKVLIKNDRNLVFIMVFGYLREVRTSPSFLLWWKHHLFQLLWHRNC